MTIVELPGAAISYAERGWPVFPVNPTTNRPLLRSAHPEGDPLRGRCQGECGRVGHGFHDATTDLGVVRRWWAKHSRASIGVRTGIAFDVLDVDHADLDRAMADLPDCEVVGPTARSGGGGWHLYVLPTGLGRRIRFSTWCDWLGPDGYVIVPPSAHKSGGRYSWTISPDEIKLRDAPRVLVDAVRASRAAGDSTTAPTIRLDRGPHRRASFRCAWSPGGLIDFVATATEGCRNDRLNWAAYRIGIDVRDGRASQPDALDALADLAHVAESIGLGRGEIIATIRSGYRAAVVS